MKKHSFEQTCWSLDDLLPATSGPEFERVLAELEESVGELEGWRERLSPDIDADDFVDFMQLYETVTRHVYRLWAYGRLWFSKDTQCQDALGFMGRMDQLRTETQNRLLFFTLWWKGLDDAPAERLMAASGDWRYFLESQRRFKPHTLTEPEEKIINLKNVNGSDALVILYDMITNKYVFKLEVEGEVMELTRAELMGHFTSPSPELREAAYREINRVYIQDGNLLGQVYAHRVRDWHSENVALRHFESPIAVLNLHNNIPDPVVDTLLDVCRENAGVFQDYFRLKAGWLGMDKLRRFDIYAPLSDVDKEYPFGPAVDTVLDSLESFAPIMAEHARRVFADNHIDSEIRPGKDVGAFCAWVLPGLSPWVLLNYAGRVSDVVTLAHELGHAIHALMAGEHSILTFGAAMPMAEVASEFAEMMLTERLLEDETDQEVRRNLLAAAVDEAYISVMRQACFVLFERQAHAMIAEGKTSDDLCAAYLEILQQHFGDAVEVDEEFQWEWVAIPHIYQTPFYCYAYSFGHLMVMALYQRYKKEGASFVPGYLKILSYGGSASPSHILSEAGIDIASADFWQGGFDVIRGMIEQLAAL